MISQDSALIKMEKVRSLKKEMEQGILRSRLLIRSRRVLFALGVLFFFCPRFCSGLGLFFWFFLSGVIRDVEATAFELEGWRREDFF